VHEEARAVVAERLIDSGYRSAADAHDLRIGAHDRGFLNVAACGQLEKWLTCRFKSSWCSASVGFVVSALTGIRLPAAVLNQTMSASHARHFVSKGWWR
jgi:hypothetical protein